jgi:hypothetical protein
MATSPQEVRRAFHNAAKLPGVLLVVDNVHRQSQVGLLLQSIPTTGAAVIVTSRMQVPPGGSAHADAWNQVHCARPQKLTGGQSRLHVHMHVHRLDSLPLQDSLQLFRAGWQRPPSISEVVEEHVVKSCGGLPLALLIVTAAVQPCETAAEWMARVDHCCNCQPHPLQLLCS